MKYIIVKHDKPYVFNDIKTALQVMVEYNAKLYEANSGRLDPLNYKSYVLSIEYGGRGTHLYYKDYEFNMGKEIPLNSDSWIPVNEYIKRVWDYETTTLYLDPVHDIGTLNINVVAIKTKEGWFINE